MTATQPPITRTNKLPLVSPRIPSTATVSSPETADWSYTVSLALVHSFVSEHTGVVTSWAWDFGDTATSTQRDPMHTYTSTGDKTVRLTVNGGAIYEEKVVPVAAAAPVSNLTADTLTVALADTMTIAQASEMTVL